jgi:hypothetical protein
LLKFGADAKTVDNAGVSVINFARYNKNLINTEAFRILEEASRLKYSVGSLVNNTLSQISHKKMEDF